MFQINRENKTGGVPGGVATGLVTGNLQVPIIIKRCVEEIERRGLDIIGNEQVNNFICRHTKNKIIYRIIQIMRIRNEKANSSGGLRKEQQIS